MARGFLECHELPSPPRLQRVKGILDMCLSHLKTGRAGAQQCTQYCCLATRTYDPPTSVPAGNRGTNLTQQLCAGPWLMLFCIGFKAPKQQGHCVLQMLPLARGEAGPHWGSEHKM
jgi:hypothetical protein